VSVVGETNFVTVRIQAIMITGDGRHFSVRMIDFTSRIYAKQLYGIDSKGPIVM
jgi:hypothetical protein